MNDRKELERLYALEYGRGGRGILRFVGLICGAVVLFEYTGRSAAFWWIGAFLAVHLLYFAFLSARLRRAVPGRHDLTIAGGLFVALLASYLWMPALLLSSTDSALVVPGAALFGLALIYMIYRADTVLSHVAGQIAVVVGMCLLTLSRVVGEVSDPLARGGVVFSVLALAAYFSVTLLNARRARLDTLASAQRSVQAQKMEAIGQLAGGVAHDFNNILTAVIGNLELYEAVPDPIERDRFVAESRAAAERAARLVQQLLAYSRKSTMQIAVHEAGTLIEEVRALTRHLIPTSIDLRIEADENLPVLVDQAQFMTALVNLVINARDAMRGGGQMTITAREEQLVTGLVQYDGYQLPPGRYARIELADTGPGIAPEILRRVTEPFFTTKPVGQGSGLGLSMVEGFARQSHGALRLLSSEAGTRAVLFLPLAGDGGEVSPAPVIPALQDAATSLRGLGLL